MIAAQEGVRLGWKYAGGYWTHARGAPTFDGVCELYIVHQALDGFRRKPV